MTQQFGMKAYMRGAALLTVAALIVKVLSAVYRVPFQNLVGDEGFYIYQQVYPFIALFVLWTSGGFAVAVSKLLADNDAERSPYVREKKRRFIMRVVFWYLIILAAISFSLLYFGANFLAGLMGDAALAPLLQSGAFIVWIMPAYAVIKGAFQSRGMMAPIAYAQIVEQCIRVAVILVGAFVVMHFTASLYEAGRMAVIGTVVGEAFGFALLALWYVRQFPRTLKHDADFALPAIMPIIKNVTWFSISVSMSSLLLLSYQFIDSFTIYSALVTSGMPIHEAKELKGIFDRGQPLVQLGIIVASSLTLTIVPLIAQHTNKKAEGGRDAQPFIRLTYRTAVLFGTGAAIGLFLLMPYINTMLFKTDSSSNILAFYMLQIIPLSIVLTFTAVLQGFDKLKIPAIILSVGFVVKLVINYLFVPTFGIVGAAVASNVGLAVTALLLVRYSRKLLPYLAGKRFYLHLAAALIMMTITVTISRLGIGFLLTSSTRIEAVIISVVSAGIGAFTFITCVAKSRLLSEKEWFLLPMGRYIASYQLWLNQKK